MNYKIEKNIPITKQYRGGVWKDLMNNMKIGDSVLVENRIAANSLVIIMRKYGYRSVTRTDGKKIRVWKMENKNANE